MGSLILKVVEFVICYIQVVVILTVLYAVKSKASYTEIGNNKDYISCCDSRFHAIQ